MRSSGTMPIPARTASRGCRNSDGAIRAIEEIAPESARSAPKIARRSSVRPAPMSPERPSTSPRRSEKLTSRTRSPRQSRSTRRTSGPTSRACGRSSSSRVRPHHQPHGLVQVEPARGPGRDQPAVAEDGDPVGDPPDLLEPMADVDDRDARTPAAGRRGGRAARPAGSRAPRSARRGSGPGTPAPAPARSRRAAARPRPAARSAPPGRAPPAPRPQAPRAPRSAARRSAPAPTAPAAGSGTGSRRR